VLTAIHKVNQLIMAEKNPARLLSEVCRLLTETRGYHNAWCVLEKNGKPVEPFFHSGFGDRFEPMAERLRTNQPPHCAKATLESNSILVIDDPPTQCADCPLAKEYVGRASLVARLRHENHDFGLLCASVPKTAAIDAEEQILFADVAHNIAHALWSIKADIRFQELTQMLPEVVFESDIDLSITYTNQRGFELFGYTKEDLATRISALELISPEDRARAGEILARRIQGQTLGPSEYQALRKDGSTFPILLNISPIMQEGEIFGFRGVIVDISERKQAEEERAIHLRFLAHMERVNRAIQQAHDVDQMMSEVLQTTLEIFEADRAWLLFPCDPEAESWSVPMERTRPKYPGAFALGQEIPMLPETASICRAALAKNDVITTDYRDPDTAQETSHRFAILAEMHMAIHPQKGKAWMFGIHQCSHHRDWTKEERTLFREIGRRLSDALSTWLLLRELQTGEKQYRLLAENATDVIWTMDMNLRFTFISQSTTALRGYTHEEAMAQSMEEMITPESLAKVMEIFGRHLQLLESDDEAVWEPVVFEADQTRKDGTTVSTSNNAKFIKGPDGLPILIVGVTHDITAQKQAEQALRESENRLQAVFNSVADYIMLLDQNHRIQLINRTEPGLTREELIGIPLYELSAPENRDRLKKHMDRVTQEAVKQQWDTAHVRPDGTKVHFNSVATPIRVAGEVVGTVVSSRDVTDQILIQKEKGQLEEQLNQAQKIESIGRLAGGVAHDFNNLLTVINSYAEFAIEDLREEDPLRADLLQVLDAGKKAATLTRQLLAFSRKQVLEPRVLCLNEIVVDLEKMLRRLIGEDIELSTSLAGDLGQITADPGQIEQVLMNLAVNAKDAMPKGGKLEIKTIDVELSEAYSSKHPDRPAGHYTMLAVSDTGLGMTDEVRARVFDPFFTTKEMGQGTGLGLSTAYGIIKQSGGFIAVFSEPGEGTTFEVYLPRAEAKDQALQDEPQFTDLRGHETILIVEDEKAVRKLTRRILSSAGYTVLSAANGGEALLECERHAGKIHLVLTDVVMPRMSGKELSARLTKVYPDLKVLFMSGYTDDAIVHHGILDEGTHFLAKPFTSPELLKKIRIVLADKDTSPA